MPPKRKRTVAVAAVAAAETLSPSASTSTAITRRVSARTKKTVDYAETPLADVTEDGTESPLTDLEEENDENKVTKTPHHKRTRTRCKKKADAEPATYHIPPVQTKTTTFNGRLGYACLNTILRALTPDPVFCSRTCRKATVLKNGLGFAQDLGRRNCRDLCRLIQWNEDNGIKFMRVSSEMFPFASHAELGYSLEYAAEELKAAGDLANKFGHRLTAHPGQFTQLGSPREAVVAASVRELEYHCQMMRYMGLGPDSVMIIHMGGVYGDKPATIARFKENYTTKLTEEMKARLVLENDEICYNVDDLLPVCDELDIPIVLDYHHNWINPSIHPLSSLIPLIDRTWRRKGIKPKQHLSSPRPGAESVMEKRAHADRCYELPAEVPDDMDLMIEAKDKEQAVLHLFRVYALRDVIHENLRAEKPPRPFVRKNGQVVVAIAIAGEGENGEREEGSGGGGGEEASPKKRRRSGKRKDAADNGELSTEGASSVATPKRGKGKGRKACVPAAATSEGLGEGGEGGLRDEEGDPDVGVGVVVKEDSDQVDGRLKRKGKGRMKG